MEEERSHVDGLLDHPPSRVLRGTGAPMNILPDGESRLDLTVLGEDL